MKSKTLTLSLTTLIMLTCLAHADPAVEELRKGKNFIPTKIYSQKEDTEIIKLFKGLRVADVSDGMDKVGLKNVGLMSSEIHPLWKDTTHYTHRIIGIAVTTRYVPTNKPHAPAMETKQFNEWVSTTYNTLTPDPAPSSSSTMPPAPTSAQSARTTLWAGNSPAASASSQTTPHEIPTKSSQKKYPCTSAT